MDLIVVLLVALSGCVVGGVLVGYVVTAAMRRARDGAVETALAVDRAASGAALATAEARLAARDEDARATASRLSDAGVELRGAQSALVDERIARTRIDAELADERTRAAERLADLTHAREELSAQFKMLAGDALETNRKRMAEQHEGALDRILKPLGEKLVAFEKKVEETYDKEAQQRFSLRQEVLNLQAATLQINEDARNLTLALKGEAKTRGNWGEVVLERVLERSGLVKGVEYRVQHTSRDEEGDVARPDIVVLLPDDKHVIIDSKVSLVAYDGYHAAPDEPSRSTHGKRHVDGMKKHARSLGEKNYQGGKDFDTPDFVAMFVPIEPAFSLATSLDPDLFLDAWDRKVVIVTPSTLLALLMTVQTLWQRDKQTRNAIQIAEESGKLHDQFVLVIESLQMLGKQLKDAQKAFEKTEERLVDGRGNLVGRIRKLQEMGAKTKKELPADLLARAADHRGMDKPADGPADGPSVIGASEPMPVPDGGGGNESP